MERSDSAEPTSQPVNQTASTNFIRVRCPSCLKLFVVDPSEIKEQRPKFECTSCASRFWLMHSEIVGEQEVMGFPVEWDESQRKNDAPQKGRSFAIRKDVLAKAQFTCPQCEEPYAGGQSECNKCGLVFEKFEARQKRRDEPVSASTELKQHWENVITHYEQKELHHCFLRACQLDDNLEYAARKYGSILEAHSGDAMALDMAKELNVMAAARLMATKTPVPEKARRVPFFSIIMVLGTIVMAMGFLIPGLRNLVGVGAAAVFLVLALRYYLFR